MKKIEFINRFMQRTGTLYKDATSIVDAVFDQIHDTLLSGEDVRINGVCKLVLRYYPPCTRTNQLSGKMIDIGPRVALRLVTFPSMKKELKAHLAKEDPK